MKRLFLAVAALLVSALLAAQTAANAASPLVRHYSDGQTLTYHMTASNDSWHYTADATGIVKKAAGSSYVEAFQWTAMTSNGQTVALPAAMLEFRELLSLDPNWMPSGPDLSKVDSRLVGPITDLMTFYVDLWLVNKTGVLKRPGDHFYVPNPQVSSWADGTKVLTGKDQIDFDLNFQSIDQAKQTAVIVVHHVPPPHPNLQFPAAWMQSPVADTPNNWVEVSKTQDGRYEAGAGKETFDVIVTVSTADGRILSATMDNPVVSIERVCEDAALTKCGDAHRQTIHRQVEVVLQR